LGGEEEGLLVAKIGGEVGLEGVKGVEGGLKVVGGGVGGLGRGVSGREVF